MAVTHLFGPIVLAIVLMSSSLGYGAATPSVDRGAVVAVYAKTQQQDSKINEKTVSEGEALFVQRCALCHLSPDGWRKSGLAPSIGPSLNGILKDGSPEREAAVRERIRMGSQAMPGFQYGLDPKQLDRVIAYLKTLR
jgi:mono/diheme cytochrome c family protein